MNNGEIKIDHDIALPDKWNRKSTAITKAIRQMKVGDSIVIPKTERSKAISSANYRGKRVATRTISAELIRVWIVEESNQ
jgi:hypothetical protein